MRIVVIGADAAGMSAAHTARRAAAAAGREIEVVVIEATGHTSYSACGIPYWIAGDVDSADDLVARTAQEHRAAGIDLRLHTRAVAIDTAARTVTVEGVAPAGHAPSARGREPVEPVECAGGEGTVGVAAVQRDAPSREQIPYDELLLATGATPFLPDWARADDGALIAGVHPVKNLDDGALWIDLLGERAHPETPAEPPRAVVVGAGYIGLEMAEALLRRGYRTTVLTRSGVMGSLDPDMGQRIEQGMRDAGIDVRPRTTVVEVRTDASGAVRAVMTDAGEEIEAEVVVVALGVTPATALGAAAGIALGPVGGYTPDRQGQVAPGVWAAGDCCEQTHRLTGSRVFLPLGTHANKQGRAVGDAMVGGALRFPGVLGTAITRFAVPVADGPDVHLEIARTGLSTRDAELAGHDVASLATEGSTASGYMPEASAIAVKVIADRGTRDLLGVQIVGGPGAGKRVDAAATALWGRMSVDDLAWMDLSYAPPFSTAWEILQIAARRLAERI